jgi:hypothetical protein
MRVIAASSAEVFLSWHGQLRGTVPQPERKLIDNGIATHLLPF